MFVEAPGYLLYHMFVGVPSQELDKASGYLLYHMFVGIPSQDLDHLVTSYITCLWVSQGRN
jgi:hypothetical protein